MGRKMAGGSGFEMMMWVEVILCSVSSASDGFSCGGVVHVNYLIDVVAALASLYLTKLRDVNPNM